MDFQKSLMIFKKVADLKSFTNAADDLELPKSAVSAAIARLEQKLGTRLLLRTTRQVQLTPDGSSFYERAEKILYDAHELENMFRANIDKISGTLRVDMPIGMAQKLVIPSLWEFIDKYPRLNVEISSTDRNVDIIYEGFDCVIRVGKNNDNNAGIRELGKKPVINCISRTYAEKYGIPKSLEDLDSHYVVDYALNFTEKNPCFEYFDGNKTIEAPMKHMISVNNSVAYHAACMSGFGIIQIPFIGVRDLINSGDIIEILPHYKPLPMPINFLTPQRRNLPARTIVFFNWLETKMDDYCAPSSD